MRNASFFFFNKKIKILQSGWETYFPFYDRALTKQLYVGLERKGWGVEKKRGKREPFLGVACKEGGGERDEK